MIPTRRTPSSPMSIVSNHIRTLEAGLRPLLDFLNRSDHARRASDPNIADFVFGNPQEMPLDGLVDAIRRHAIPANKDWFAYTVHNQAAAETIAAALVRRTGLPFQADDVRFTPG